MKRVFCSFVPSLGKEASNPVIQIPVKSLLLFHLTVRSSLLSETSDLPVRLKPRLGSLFSLNYTYLLTLPCMGWIFELSWNMIPSLHGKRILKILITSFINSVFMGALTYRTGEGGTDKPSAFMKFIDQVNVA